MLPSRPLGVSAAMRQVEQQIQMCAAVPRNILLVGPTGVGKGLVACSPRARAEHLCRRFHHARGWSVVRFTASQPALRSLPRCLHRRGPGQYDQGTLGLVLRPDGRLIFGDNATSRLIMFALDGTFLEDWPVENIVVTSQSLTVDTAGHTYLKILVGQTAPELLWPIGLLHLDTAGFVVDTILPPPVPGEPIAPGGPFDPWKVWAMSPQGYLLVGLNDRYRFDILTPGRPVRRVGRLWQPVPLTEGERGEWEELRLWQTPA